MKRAWFILCAIALLVLMVSCQSVPSSVIGTETRAGIDDLKDQTKDIASQADAIDSGVDSVAQDLEDLEKDAPDALRPEIRAIQEKVTIIAAQTEAHKEATAGTAKVAADTKDSFEDDMGKVAVLGAEKAEAEVKVEKATGQRNVAWLILGGLGIVGIVLIWLKFKTGILGITNKLL